MAATGDRHPQPQSSLKTVVVASWLVARDGSWMDYCHCPFFRVSAMAGGWAEAEEVIASEIWSDGEVKEGRSAFFMKIVLMIDD